MLVEVCQCGPPWPKDRPMWVLSDVTFCHNRLEFRPDRPILVELGPNFGSQSNFSVILKHLQSSPPASRFGRLQEPLPRDPHRNPTCSRPYRHKYAPMLARTRMQWTDISRATFDRQLRRHARTRIHEQTPRGRASSHEGKRETVPFSNPRNPVGETACGLPSPPKQNNAQAQASVLIGVCGRQHSLCVFAVSYLLGAPSSAAHLDISATSEYRADARGGGARQGTSPSIRAMCDRR